MYGPIPSPSMKGTIGRSGTSSLPFVIVILAPSGASLWGISVLEVELGNHSLEAVGADAVTELGVGMLSDVAIDLFPIILIAPDPLAVAADWQQSAELLHLQQRRLQLGHALGQPLLQLQHADTDVDSRSELIGVERLHDVVVSPGVEAGHHVLAAAPPCEQNHVHVCECRILSNAATELRSVDARHHPVDNGECGSIACAQQLPRRLAVVRDGDLDVPLL